MAEKELTFAKVLTLTLLGLVGFFLALPWIVGALANYAEWVRHIMMGLR